MKKSLHHSADFNEIVQRIHRLSEDSQKKWGKMNAAQMLMHCHLVLQIPLRKVNLPSLAGGLRAIGIITKKEMWIFNNGIPRNMPSFKKVIVNFECDFEEARKKLLNTLDEYILCYHKHELPDKHELFGRMSEKDWGFLEFKHLNHHLNQFSV